MIFFIDTNYTSTVINGVNTLGYVLKSQVVNTSGFSDFHGSPSRLWRVKWLLPIPATIAI